MRIYNKNYKFSFSPPSILCIRFESINNNDHWRSIFTLNIVIKLFDYLVEDFNFFPISINKRSLKYEFCVNLNLMDFVNDTKRYNISKGWKNARNMQN